MGAPENTVSGAPIILVYAQMSKQRKHKEIANRLKKQVFKPLPPFPDKKIRMYFLAFYHKSKLFSSRRKLQIPIVTIP